MLNSIEPLAFIEFSVLPLVNSFAISFTSLEHPFISVAIAVTFKPSAMSFIILPLSFVDPTIIINHDARTFSLISVKDQASVDCIFELDYLKVWSLLQIIITKQLANHAITSKFPFKHVNSFLV